MFFLRYQILLSLVLVLCVCALCAFRYLYQIEYQFGLQTSQGLFPLFLYQTKSAATVQLPTGTHTIEFRIRDLSHAYTAVTRTLTVRVFLRASTPHAQLCASPLRSTPNACLWLRWVRWTQPRRSLWRKRR